MHEDQLRYFLKKYKIEPRKQQGQNFLIDETVVQASIDAAELTAEDIVLEIGPGFGSLTTHLAKVAHRVVAVEQDRVLFSALKDEVIERFDTLEIYNEDIRTFHLEEHGLKDLEYKMVANLPYSVTSWILRTFMENPPRPSRMVVMVQKEVGQRLTAPAGKKSLLSVAAQLLTVPEIVKIIGPESFMPAPRVDSAIVRLDVRPDADLEEVKKTISVAKMGFSSRRKQLHNNLAAGTGRTTQEMKELMTKAGLKDGIRPQELEIGQWKELAKHF